MSLDIWLSYELEPGEYVTVFSANITHNLSEMWSAAGIREVLYDKEDTQARDHVVAIRAAIEDMRAKPDTYRKYDSPNGWGTYNGAVPWLEKLLCAFEKFPSARIRVSA